MCDAAGSTAVESEGEFRQVAVEVLEADGSLVGAEDPALEQREHQMNPRQHLCGRLIEPRDHRHDVLIPLVAKAGMAVPTIGMGGFAWTEVGLEDAETGGGRNVGGGSDANPAAAAPPLFHGGDGDGLFLGRPPGFARLPPADITLVDFDGAGQRSAIGPDGGGADLVQPGPWLPPITNVQFMFLSA